MAAKKKKASTTVRLERGDGSSRVFWEITCDGLSFTTRYGRHLNEGRVTPAKKFRSSDAMDEAVAQAIVAKRKEGYAEPRQRAASGATSRKGVSVRNPELEAMIDADPTNAEGYLVYADWLSEQGDARGELINIQHGLATTTDSRARTRLERDEKELFAKFGAELLGKYSEYTFLRNSERSFRTFSWRFGFIHAARLAPFVYTRIDVTEVLEALGAHPAGRFLEHVILGHLGANEILEALRKLPTLRSVTIGDCATSRLQNAHQRAPEGSNLEGFWEAMPKLRRFGAVAPIARFGEFAAPELESLSFTATNTENLPALQRAKAPKLRSLRIALATPFELKALSAVFESFPALEELSIQRWSTVESHPFHMARSKPILVQEDDLVTMVVAAAAARKLRRLDIEIPMSERGAERLLSLDLHEIGQLRIPSDAVNTKLQKRLSTAAPHIEWTDTPEVEELDLPEISA